MVMYGSVITLFLGGTLTKTGPLSSFFLMFTFFVFFVVVGGDLYWWGFRLVRGLYGDQLNLSSRKLSNMVPPFLGDGERGRERERLCARI